jgi:hypothetical protein
LPFREARKKEQEARREIDEAEAQTKRAIEGLEHRFELAQTR